ncbi:MAG: DMT family transporter [Phycisphaerales bacterium]|nr:DMT family transporter [Phycisphaerales bacterium]
MPVSVIVLVLMAALFHAIWNGLIKSGNDPLMESMLLCIAWIVICMILIPVLPIPNRQSWPYIFMAVIIHVCYFLLLSKSYSMGDFSAVYPVVRGLPPLIVLLVSVLFIEEPLSLAGATGASLIAGGVLVLEFGNKCRSVRMLFFAFLTALMIAFYTVVDGLGARKSGHSTSFFAWFTLLQSIIYVAIVFRVRGRTKCVKHIRSKWKLGFLGGLMSFSAYSIVLWAMTKAPIPFVSALRETSVLFASVIAIVFLGEPVRKNRIFSAALIFAGILILK